MKKPAILSVFLLLLFTGTTEGQFIDSVSKVGTTAAPFLEIGIGPRAISMGGAFVSVSDDATGLYWNPSGISRIQGNQAVFHQTQWLADISHTFAGAVFQAGRGNAIGAGITAVNMDEMPVRTVHEPDGTGERFTASSLALGISGARNLTDRVSVGFTGKYIQEQIWHMTASAIALDIGTLFRSGWNGLTLGMAITNFGSKMHLEGRDTRVKHDIDPVHEGNNSKINAHLDTDEWSLPLNFQVGVSMNLLDNRWSRFTVAVDAMHPNNNTESVNTGFEYAIREMFFLRGGYKTLFQEDSEEGFTLGGGIHYSFTPRFTLMVDYAYADFGVLNNVQRFAVGLGF